MKTALRRIRRFLPVLALVGAIFLPASVRAADAGWVNLFDGKTLDGWEQHRQGLSGKRCSHALFSLTSLTHGFMVGRSQSTPDFSFSCSGLSTVTISALGSKSGQWSVRKGDAGNPSRL